MYHRVRSGTQRFPEEKIARTAECADSNASEYFDSVKYLRANRLEHELSRQEGQSTLTVCISAEPCPRRRSR